MFKAIGGFSHPHQSHINPCGSHTLSLNPQQISMGHTESYRQIHYPVTSCSCHPIIIRSSPIQPTTNNSQLRGLAPSSPRTIHGFSKPQGLRRKRRHLPRPERNLKAAADEVLTALPVGRTAATGLLFTTKGHLSRREVGI
jgi:hypothetical protein